MHRVLASLALVALSATVAAAAAPSYRIDAPFIRDRAGRAVFFHGVNAVWKLTPYYPPSTLFGDSEATSYFDRRDADFLAANGLNSVRLGVLFVGVEPARGVIDERYLDRIARIVKLLKRSGVTVLLDFHQDLYNERYAGEGFPDWATIDDGIPATNELGFPGNYFTPAVTRAFDNLWANRDTLWDEYRNAWQRVAARFGGMRNVVGYDLFNEPWPGSQVSTCANPEGCPVFDTQVLQPFYEHVVAGIRAADARSIVWWEPNVTNDFGAANGVGTITPIGDPASNQGISFHAYCLIGGLAPGVSRTNDPACPTQEQLAFQNQVGAAARNGSGLFLTEFGASDESADIARVAAQADAAMISWHYWAYGSWSDPTGNPNEEGLFADDLDRPGSLKQAKADLLIRTYPQAVAGTPQSFAFDPTTKRFTLTYEAAPTIRKPTIVFVPVARHYGGHYEVAITGPARVTSAPDAPLLQVRNTGDPGDVAVMVKIPRS